MNTGKICLVCGAEYPFTQLFCPNDGSPLRSSGGNALDLVGQIIADRYYVVRQLGEGGMGRVYLVEHVKMGKKIALKVLRPSVALDADSISRFNREATNASKISHPNVAQIYDFGETSDGLLFLAMEFVDGEPLSTLIALGPMQPARAADIVRQTGEALASAHELGIVHRDLKPDNIMIARARDNRDLVKVVDFGIAKSSHGPGQTLTKAGSLIGTPDYMSPERIVGDRVDSRSDIYSLGLVAFKMLAHGLPFPGESAQETIVRRLTDNPKQLKEVCPEIEWPAQIQQVIDRALDRDPDHRYQTAMDFATDFAAAVRFAQSPESRRLAETSANDAKVLPNGSVPALQRNGQPNRRVQVSRALNRYVLGAIGSIAVVCIVGFAAWRSHHGPHTQSQVQSQGEVAPSNKPAGPAALIDSGVVLRSAAPLTAASQTAKDRKSKFPVVRLIVNVVGFPPGLEAQIRRAAGSITGVTLASDATIGDSAVEPDFLIHGDSNGGILLERSDVARTIVERFDTTSLIKRFPDAIRQQAALKILAVLDNGTSGAGASIDLGSATPTFLIGRDIPIHVHSVHGGFLTLVDVNPEGGAEILYPGPTDHLRRIAAGEDMTFDQGQYSASAPTGRGVLRAIVTDRPLGLTTSAPVLELPDGPVLAFQVDRAVQRLVDAGAERWATASVVYRIK